MDPEIRNTKFGRGWKTECFLDDQAVSKVWVNDRTMRIGSACIKMGGIGGVATNRNHRNRGYSRLCMEAANELMVREAYGMAFLFGIGDFYDKFGYITCMPEHTFTIDTRNAERISPGVRTRAAIAADNPGIARIYNRDNATLTGSCIRNARWSGFTMGSYWNRKVSARVVRDGRNKLIGYVAYDNETDKCCASEIGGTDVRVYEAILDFLASRAVKLRREEISFKLPTDHPFSRWARQFGLKDATAYPRNGNAMARITDLEACFESLSEELSARSSGFRGQAEFRLATDIGNLRIAQTRGEISIGKPTTGVPVVRISQNHLTKLLMGYVSPNDLIIAGTLKAPKSIHPFLKKLFPLQTSQLWWSDRF